MYTLALTTVLLVVLACDSSANAEEPLTVFVVNHPLQVLAKRIGKDAVEVRFPAPGDVDPAHWRPEPDAIAAYQSADLILANGAGYAQWLGTATLPRRRVVDTTAGARDRLIPIDEGMSHSHGPGGRHSHGRVASTTWLDPTLALEQARAVTEALASMRKAQAPAFRSNLATLEQELTEIDAGLEKATRPLRGEPLLFSHPVYQYLERRYALDGRSLHWEPDEPPDEAAWRDLDRILRTHPANTMIWEEEPTAETRSQLEDRGIAIVVLRPSGASPSSGDFLAELRRFAADLERVGTPPS